MKAKDLYRQKYKIIKFFNDKQLDIIREDIKTLKREPGLVSLNYDDRKIALKVKSNFKQIMILINFMAWLIDAKNFMISLNPKLLLM